MYFSSFIPRRLIEMLNNLYISIDKTLDQFDVYKMETVGKIPQLFIYFLFQLHLLCWW